MTSSSPRFGVGFRLQQVFQFRAVWVMSSSAVAEFMPVSRRSWRIAPPSATPSVSPIIGTPDWFKDCSPRRRSKGDPDTNRITQVWLVTYVDGKGLEVDRIRELLKIVFSSGPRGAMRRTLGLAAIH